MSLDRRRFLSDATGLAAASAVGRWVPNEVFAGADAGAKKSANETIVCAVVGVGGRGAGLASLAAEHPGVAVAAVCDVDRNKAARVAAGVGERQGTKVGHVDDFRRLIDDDSIDAVIIATPHHWHCPIAIRALDAGKDVYVEKPASHVFSEGPLLIEAARRKNRIVQHGTQMRSSEVTLAAGKVLADGMLGDIKLARAWSIEPRRHPLPVKDEQPPEGLDYEMWLGAAPQRPYNRNRVGRWRWYRDYGNGEMGDDGIHDIDLGRWGLGVETHPVRISAQGGRIDLKGETEYPNHLNASFQYADGRELLYETRNWAPYRMHGFDSGNTFYGTQGYMVFSRRGYFQTYLGAKEEKGPGLRGGGGNREHMDDFLRSVRTRKPTHADAETAHLSAALVHLGEIAYRTGRALRFDPKTETFPGDAEANGMLTKNYRSPWEFTQA